MKTKAGSDGVEIISENSLKDFEVNDQTIQCMVLDLGIQYPCLIAMLYHTFCTYFIQSTFYKEEKKILFTRRVLLFYTLAPIFLLQLNQIGKHHKSKGDKCMNGMTRIMKQNIL